MHVTLVCVVSLWCKYYIKQNLCSQGISGIVPWSALNFMTMFLQYCNMSDVEAAIITASLLLGGLVAGPIGGLVGDALHAKYPNHGRPFVGQFAMIFRLPLVIVAFVVIPFEQSSFAALLIISICLGLFSIAGVAVNRPIMADVVRPEHRGTIFSFV